MPVEDKKMKNSKGILTGFAATLWMFMGTNVMGQGSLTPPGAPGETMKTLAQVEPRTPISSLPYTISEPGSYYVTGNLSSTGHGIVIEASGVSVDLMGFSLTWDGGNENYGGPGENAYNGIYVTGSAEDKETMPHIFVAPPASAMGNGASSVAMIENLVIKRGRISGFHDGLRCENMSNSRIKELVVSGNIYEGVFLSGYDGQCNGNTIADCTISGNGQSGIYVYGYSGGCNGNTITDCTINGNEDEGIYLRSNSGGQCDGNTIADCTISGNGDEGVYLRGSYGQCSGNTVANCTIGDNTGRGIYLLSSQGQCDGNTLHGNSIMGNDGHGIYINGGDGNRIEGNNVWGTTGEGDTWGIYTYNTLNNLILKNSCVENGTNYELDPNDTAGPIVSIAGFLSATGDASHPWANFSKYAIIVHVD